MRLRGRDDAVLVEDRTRFSSGGNRTVSSANERRGDRLRKRRLKHVEPLAAVGSVRHLSVRRVGQPMQRPGGPSCPPAIRKDEVDATIEGSRCVWTHGYKRGLLDLMTTNG